MFASTMNSAPTMVDAQDHRQVLRADRVDRQQAQARETEGGLGEDRAAEQAAHVEAEDRRRSGVSAARSAVPADHGPAPQALGRAVRM